jgi:hypothetical protein
MTKITKQNVHILNALFEAKIKQDPSFTFEELCNEYGTTEKEVLVIQGKADEEIIEEEKLVEELKEDDKKVEEILNDIKKSFPEILKVDDELPLEYSIMSIEEQLSNINAKPDVVIEEKPSIFENKEIPNKVINTNIVEEKQEEFDFFSMVEDPSTLRINNDEVNKILYLEEIKSNKPTTKIVCASSAYIAHISSVSLADKAKLRNSGNSHYEINENLFKTIYKHIEVMEPSKPPYDKWLKMTAYADLPLFYYGLYASTFKRDNEFNITCPSCKVDNKVAANPENLIEVKDDKIHERISIINQDVKTYEDLEKLTLVGKTERLRLNTSKLFIEFKNFSLRDYLHVARKKPRESMKDNLIVYQYLLVTNAIYILDEENSKRENKPVFYAYTDLTDIVNILSDRIAPDDEQDMINFVEALLSRYSIDFNLPKFNCGSCSTEIGPFPFDPQEMLFSRLAG